MREVPLVLSKKFCRAFAVGAGALIGFLFYSLGENTGHFHGMRDTNQYYETALRKLAEKYKPQEEETEKTE